MRLILILTVLSTFSPWDADAAGPVIVDTPRELMPAPERIFHTSTDLALSADGRWLAAAHRTPPPDDRPVIVIRDLMARTGDQVIPTRDDHEHTRLNPPVFSPNGADLAFVELGRPAGGSPLVFKPAVRLWNVERGEQVWESDLETKWVGWHRIAFPPDGQELFVSAGSGRDYEARLYSVDRQSGNVDRLVIERGNAYQMAVVSLDGRYLLQAENPAERVTVWELTRTRLRKTARGEEQITRVAQFQGTAPFAFRIDLSPDGKLAAVIGPEKGVNIWSFSPRVIAGRVIKRPLLQIRRRGQERTIMSTSFSRDGKFLAVGHGEGIDMVELATERVHTRFTTGDSQRGISNFVFTPDGRTIIAREDTGRVIAWTVPPAGLSN